MIPNRMRKRTLQECGPPHRKTCINMSITSTDEEGIVTLYSVQFWSPPGKRDVSRLERVQRVARKMIQALGSCHVMKS